MWKKICMTIIAMITTLSGIYAYYNYYISAANSSGSYYGRINQAPNGISGSNIGMQKGDKFNTGIRDASGNYLSWSMIAPYDSKQWLVMSTTSIGSTNIYENGGFSSSVGHYRYTKLKPYIDALDAQLTSSMLENQVFIPHIINASWGSDEHQKQDTSATGFFLINYAEKSALGITEKEASFSDDYWCSNLWSSGTKIWYSISSNGTANAKNLYTGISHVRPAASINISNIVFAVSNSPSPVQDNENKIIEINLGNDDIYSNTVSNPDLKLRILETSYSASISGLKNNQYQDLTKHNNAYQITKGSVISMDASGSGGTALSAIVFNDKNEFVYYYPKMIQNNGYYTLDTSKWELGSYKICVVSEDYDASNALPIKSSALSETVSLNIVAPHKLTYTKKPESGASVGKDYEFSKNVNVGQNVGVITVNPQGIMPLTYTIESDGDNSYQNFELDGLDSNHSSSNTSLDVKIKSGAPDLVNGGLKGGTYRFCVSAIDVNGNPTTSTSDSKICASFTVEKTNLTVAFNDPNQTKKSIAQAQAGWSENATATPNNGVKITYAKSGGSIGLINIDPDTGAITYTGGTGYGKVTIKATADDDPSSGNDNYEPGETTKEIVIYREVDGSVTPHTNSSSTTSPTFQTSDVNVKPNGVIGKITGTLGTPDNAASGTTTYTYGLKNAGDYNYFNVNPSTGDIKTTADLSTTTGTYHITVTVSDKWSTKEIPVTITVGLAGAENLQFYENSTSNTVINTKTVNFTDTNVSVFATVKNSSNMNPVTYSIQDGSTNVITINPNSGAITIVGTGTVTIVADKQGASGQADSQATLTFTVTAGAQNFIYTTDSTLTTERPKTGNYYDALKETYAPNKTFKVYTTGNPPGSTVTYQLKATSPTDVISVDSDGTIHILNASLNNQIGKVVVEATSHDPSGNYNDVTIELPIDIEKGERKIVFAENPVNVVSGSGSVAPNILVDGVLDTSGTAVIEVDSNESSIAWTNDGITIQYNWNDAQGKDIKLQATKPADRNYKATTVEGKLHILGADENVLTLSTPGKIIYGDHFTIRSTQDDSASTNVQYTFETDNQVFISTPQVNGNKAEFDALAYSGSTTINVKVTRTADGELPLTKTVQIKVLPKPITITIDDKEKKRLEENPPLTFQDFTSQLVSWNGVKDTIDTSHIKLSTTAKKYSPIGSYPITSGNAEKQLNDNYPNYTFTIKQGLLNVIDNGNKDFWDIDDDGCPDLNIKITDDKGNGVIINGDLNDDGIPDFNIDTNGDGKPDLNIDTDNDGKPDVNLVILKDWKPTKCVTLGDVQYSSGITAKPEINVDVDGDLIPDINIDTDGDMKADINIKTENILVNIANHTTWTPNQDYNYQGFLYDTEKDIKPLLNIDSDGDGRPDINIDLDDDGNADINIDTDGDGIPNTNIDSTGDGKPDINIDKDGDGEPDENIKEITEWKPEHNVNKPFEYDTMRFDEPDDEEPSDKPDTEVGGSYYPGNNMGGALTGDVTNPLPYLSISIISLIILFLLFQKHKAKKHPSSHPS